MAIGATPHRGALNFSANKPKDMSSAARLYKQKQETHTHTHKDTHICTQKDTQTAGLDKRLYMLEVLES